jgi:hypothetical protein
MQTLTHLACRRCTYQRPRLDMGQDKWQGTRLLFRHDRGAPLYRDPGRCIVLLDETLNTLGRREDEQPMINIVHAHTTSQYLYDEFLFLTLAPSRNPSVLRFSFVTRLGRRYDPNPVGTHTSQNPFLS